LLKNGHTNKGILMAYHDSHRRRFFFNQWLWSYHANYHPVNGLGCGKHLQCSTFHCEEHACFPSLE